MYFLSIHVDGDCSLARATENNESKIIVSNIYNTINGSNSLLAYSVGSDINNSYHLDFNNIKFMKGKYANMFIGTKKGHKIMESIAISGGIPMYPYVAFNGGESYFVMHFSKAAMMENIELVEKNNKIKNYDYVTVNSGDGVLDITKRLNHEINLLNLTATEQKIIQEAFRNGYLDWPRNISLDDLAREFSISKTTVLFHIRKAESKLISCLLSK
ncbi:helix-turn-helix domain-containing protein [Ferroplasma sp.]|uniref:helix-turn-helix domain-containing protein n=1 Tax=Ferroplasma sp. TaxID=2591003 RepID=UPI00307E2537